VAHDNGTVRRNADVELERRRPCSEQATQRRLGVGTVSLDLEHPAPTVPS
jgi:hypothetical protein